MKPGSCQKHPPDFAYLVAYQWFTLVSKLSGGNQQSDCSPLEILIHGHPCQLTPLVHRLKFQLTYYSIGLIRDKKLADQNSSVSLVEGNCKLLLSPLYSGWSRMVTITYVGSHTDNNRSLLQKPMKVLGRNRVELSNLVVHLPIFWPGMQPGIQVWESFLGTLVHSQAWNLYHRQYKNELLPALWKHSLSISNSKFGMFIPHRFQSCGTAWCLLSPALIWAGINLPGS